MRRFTNLFLAFCFVLCAQRLAAQNFNLQLRDNLPYNVSLSNLWGYAANGNEYALVGAYNGLSIVDVTNPDAISEVAFVPHDNNFWREAKVWNNRAYVTNEGGGGVLIVNLSNLPNVTSTEFTYDGLETSHTLWIDENGIMYLFGYDTQDDIPTAEQGAMMFDLNADPDNPTWLANYNGSYIHDGFVRGDTLWASEIYDGQLTVYDVTDKSNFQLLALKTTPLSFAHNAWPTSDNQFVFTTDEKPNSTLAAYNVSDLSNITLLDEAQTNPGSGSVIHNVHLVNNDFAAVSYYRDGATIFDVSEPDNIILVGAYDTSPLTGDGFNGAWGVYPYLPSGNWLVSDIENGLFVFTPTYQKAARLQGVVTDSVTNLPVNGVAVTILANGNGDQTNLAGDYKTGVDNGGSYQVQFLKLGYAPKTITVNLVNDSIVTLDVALTPLQGFPLVVNVVDAQNNAALVTNASYSITDYGLMSANGVGTSNIIIDNVYPSDYDITIGRWGYKTQTFNLGQINTGDTVDLALQRGYYDDFLFNFGWTKTQTATSGHWERGLPAGTTFDNTVTNPYADVVGDFGATCYVTGNDGGEAADDDVDGGHATLKTPAMDLTGYNDPYIRYARWFANTGGQGSPVNDSLIVTLHGSGAPSVIDVITGAQDAASLSQWIVKTVRVADFMSPSNNMFVAFRAVDASPGHIVEAALDVFQVLEGDEVNVSAVVKQNDGWMLYPNPATNELRLASAVHTPGSFEIVAVTGALVQNGLLNESGVTAINTSALLPGYYLVAIETGASRVVLPFVKH